MAVEASDSSGVNLINRSEQIDRLLILKAVHSFELVFDIVVVVLTTGSLTMTIELSLMVIDLLHFSFKQTDQLTILFGHFPCDPTDSSV